MDYLFDRTVTNIPKDYSISCYYIVDNHLRFVSLNKSKYFYLHYVDSFQLGERIRKSDNEYTFDVYVITLNKPILTAKSEFSEDSRVVRITTPSGNPLSKKNKKPQENTVITRYLGNNKNKLF